MTELRRATEDLWGAYRQLFAAKLGISRLLLSMKQSMAPADFDCSVIAAGLHPSCADAHLSGFAKLQPLLIEAVAIASDVPAMTMADRDIFTRAVEAFDREEARVFAEVQRAIPPRV
jgi:hypothetical protein